MAEIELTSETFQQDVLEADKPVLVDFWAEWCVPCRMLVPIIEELAEDLEGKAYIAKANVDEMPEISEKYQIQSIPSIFLFHKGEVVKQSVGVATKDALMEMFEGLL